MFIFVVKKQTTMRKLTLLLCLLMPLSMMAQRKITVFDLEMKVPLRNVMVWVDHAFVDSTDYLGQVTLPRQADTLVVSKLGYISLRIPGKLVSDTIPLLRDFNQIGEVIVYGEDRSERLQQRVDNWMKVDKTEYALQHPKTGVSFDFWSLFDGSRRRKRKAMKKQRAIFEEMDEQARRNNKDLDPIYRAYRDALQEKPEP